VQKFRRLAGMLKACAESWWSTSINLLAALAAQEELLGSGICDEPLALWKWGAKLLLQPGWFWYSCIQQVIFTWGSTAGIPNDILPYWPAYGTTHCLPTSYCFELSVCQVHPTTSYSITFYTNTSHGSKSIKGGMEYAGQIADPYSVLATAFQT
jgi:hypothetical protein